MASADDIIVEINAKTANFVKGLDKAEAKTDKFVKNSVKGNKRLSKAFKEAAASTAILQGPLGPVAGRISAIGAAVGRVNPLVIAMGVAFAALSLGMKDAVSAGTKLESQMFKLEAITKATGKSAGLSAAAINEFAQGLGESTLTSASAVREASGLLLTFRSISGETFKETLRLAQDLSASGFGDLRTTTLSLAKALEDPILGLTSLRRQGVMFTDAQQDMIKSLVATGDKLSAQKAILAEVNQQVGGAGVGAAQGLAGAWDTLSERWTRWMEQASTSTGLLGALNAAVTMLSDRINASILPAENAAKAQRLWTEQVTPNIAAFRALGISIDEVDPSSLIEVERALKDLASRGIDIANVSSETAALQAQFVQFSGKVDAARKSLIAMAEAGVTDEAVFASQRKVIDKLAPAVAVLGDHFRNLATEMNTAAAEAQAFDAEFEAAMKAEADNIEQADVALKAFAKSWPKLRDALDPVGAAMREQQAAIDTLTMALRLGKLTADEFQQAIDNLALGGPESEDVDTTESDREKERAAEKLALMDETNATAEEKLAIHMGKNLQIIQDGLDAGVIAEADAAKRRQGVVDRFNKAKNNLESRQFKSGLSNAQTFFSGMMTLTKGSSKGIFNAMKAGAIATAIVQTHQSVTNAMASVPFPYNFVAAGASLVKGLSAVNSIRSTSFGGGGGGGGSGGGAPGGGGATPAPTTIAAPDTSSFNQPSTRVEINLGDEDELLSKSSVRRLINSINEEIADGAVIGSIGAV